MFRSLLTCQVFLPCCKRVQIELQACVACVTNLWLLIRNVTGFTPPVRASQLAADGHCVVCCRRVLRCPATVGPEKQNSEVKGFWEVFYNQSTDAFGRLAQLVRASALQAEGPRFEPATAHHSSLGLRASFRFVSSRRIRAASAIAFKCCLVAGAIRPHRAQIKNEKRVEGNPESKSQQRRRLDALRIRVRMVRESGSSCAGKRYILTARGFGQLKMHVAQD